MNIEKWITNRQQLTMEASGSILCTYAAIYYPNEDGKIAKLFSLQASDFQGSPVIIDGAYAELAWLSKTEIPALPIAKLDTLMFRTPNALHVGRLYQETINKIRSLGATDVADLLQATGGYCYFRPDNFAWELLPKKYITSDSDDEVEKKNYLPWLIGATIASFVL